MATNEAAEDSPKMTSVSLERAKRLRALQSDSGCDAALSSIEDWHDVPMYHRRFYRSKTLSKAGRFAEARDEIATAIDENLRMSEPHFENRDLLYRLQEADILLDSDQFNAALGLLIKIRELPLSKDGALLPEVILREVFVCYKLGIVSDEWKKVADDWYLMTEKYGMSGADIKRMIAKI